MVECCGNNHPECKTWAPEYKKAAQKAKDTKKPYTFVKINILQNPGITKTLSANKFPALRLFVNGILILYSGNNTADALLAFMENKTGPQSTLLSTPEEFQAVLNKKGLRCILATNKTEIVMQYMDLAREYEDVTFYHAPISLTKEAIKEVTEENSLALLRDFDEQLVVLSRPTMSRKQFQDFIRNNEYPLVAPCKEKIFETVYRDEKPRTGIMLFRNKEADGSEALDTEFKELATEFQSINYTFVLGNAKDDCKKYTDYEGIEEKDLPIMQIVLMKDKQEERYLYRGPFTGKTMKEFFNDWKKGKAKRFYKSEEIPASNPGPVFKLVGKSFDKEVMGSDKNVLVKFYAPWCKHCKLLAPIYEDICLLYTSPSPRDLSTSRMPSSA
eukprot:TRINITY_DN2459_c0_g3_i2.p1 TRINITY_DN2459_c0_g3~~TRINITY_DN2459_c0_g3_i2.p1  ORF type:complete len:386 (-),score=112.76 TRINITY_DN2459_c0_g3_i2:14-1171(-)